MYKALKEGIEYKCLKERKYYKYIFSDYTVPTMTSNTTPEGFVSSNTSSATNTSEAYVMWFGGTYYYSTYTYNGQTIYNQYNFKNIIKAGTYTLSFTLNRQPNATTKNRRFIIIDENDNETIVWSLENNLPNSDTDYTYSVSITVPNFKAIKYMADSKCASATYIVDRVKNVNLTGLKIVTGTQDATSQDYDFYRDEYKALKI